MNKSRLKIVLWNANGLSQHNLELTSFICKNSIDIVLVSETHFSEKSFLKIPNFKIFCTNHPNNRAQGGTAIIINKNIKCVALESYREEHLQATSVQVEDFYGTLVLSAIYCPPKHNNTTYQYIDYLKTLGNRYIAGGDFNAKNTIWGSRLTNAKGRQLLDAIYSTNSRFISTGEPTYWPTDIKKRPDLIDFCITKSIKHDHLTIKTSYELSSDHSPVILTYQSTFLLETRNKNIYNNYTDWSAFREIIENKLNINVSLKNNNEIDSAIAYLNDNIIQAASDSTPMPKHQINNYIVPSATKEKIKIKRKMRKQWQTTRSPQDKTNLNQITKELKEILKKDKEKIFEKYITNLSSTSTTNYSLWRATKNINSSIVHQPPLKNTENKWAKTQIEKANVLSAHFKNTFTNKLNNQNIILPNLSNNSNDQIKKITSKEIKLNIKYNVKLKKSPGYDRITGEILKELPEKAINYLRNLYNAAIAIKYFPVAWKVAEIIAIPKPHKDPTEATSYRPISLLPTMSKLFEKLIFNRLEPIITSRNLIPNHQFGFRRKHSTIEQVHRVTNKISSEIDKKNFCVAVYLDVAKAFDSVWHKGLMHKLKHQLPHSYYQLIRSYISDRYFYVKQQDESSDIQKIEAGVPQGSVLGPLLYLLHTADIPIPPSGENMIATFADDTVLLSSNKNIDVALTKLQTQLDSTLLWFKKWGIEINSSKTVQVIYTNRRYSNYHLHINNEPIKIDKKAKYLGMIIDAKLLWKEHIMQKRQEINNRFRQLYWILGRQSRLSITNKLLIFKSIIMPIWRYGIEMWGTATKSNTKIIQRIQSKILRTIANAEWYISNEDIRRELNIESVEEVIQKCSHKHMHRLLAHTNPELREIPALETSQPRRLKRCTPTELVNR